MGHNTVSLLAVIWFVTATYGDGIGIQNARCNTRSGSCPEWGSFDERYCCESNGPHCCRAKEYLWEHKFIVAAIVIIPILLCVVSYYCCDFFCRFCCRIFCGASKDSGAVISQTTQDSLEHIQTGQIIPYSSS